MAQQIIKWKEFQEQSSLVGVPDSWKSVSPIHILQSVALTLQDQTTEITNENNYHLHLLCEQCTSRRPEGFPQKKNSIIDCSLTYLICCDFLNCTGTSLKLCLTILHWQNSNDNGFVSACFQRKESNAAVRQNWATSSKLVLTDDWTRNRFSFWDSVQLPELCSIPLTSHHIRSHIFLLQCHKATFMKESGSEFQSLWDVFSIDHIIPVTYLK
jgi:RNAse (barnase) inhibitor barstar